MNNELSPPDYTKSDEKCRLRAAGRECCNAQNYLRPHKCNVYCVAKLDRWLREEHPEFNEESRLAIVAKLTHHNSE